MFSLFVSKDKQNPIQLLIIHPFFKNVLYMAGQVHQRFSTQKRGIRLEYIAKKY
jgi:hypothetical protein